MSLNMFAVKKCTKTFLKSQKNMTDVNGLSHCDTNTYKNSLD